MLAKTCRHCASKSSLPTQAPLFSAATWPAMNRNSDAFTRVICEYCPSGLPSASGLKILMSGIGLFPSIRLVLVVAEMIGAEHVRGTHRHGGANVRPVELLDALATHQAEVAAHLVFK